VSRNGRKQLRSELVPLLSFLRIHLTEAYLIPDIHSVFTNLHHYFLNADIPPTVDRENITELYFSYLSDFQFILTTSKHYEVMKNGVIWDITPLGSCKNQRFGGKRPKFIVHSLLSP
jgi:hypothetical protein